jgi:hypothetical protein
MTPYDSLVLAQAENPQLLDLRDFKAKSAEYGIFGTRTQVRFLASQA